MRNIGVARFAASSRARINGRLFAPLPSASTSQIMAGRPPIANPETDPGSSLRGRGVDVLTMWWKWMAGIGAAVLTVVVAGVVVLAPGDGSRPMAGTLTTTTSAS